MSTFTPNKNIEQPAPGSDNNTWATPVNSDWGIIDTAFGGVTSIVVTGVGAGTYTLNTTQYTPPNIEFTGSISANLNYQVPNGVGGFWSVFNNTSGASSLTFSSGGGGSQLVPSGQRAFLISDGSNMQFAQTGGAKSASPTAQVALSAINGTAATYMTSDSAPALNVGISPTWTSPHTFSAQINSAGNLAVTAGTLSVQAPALANLSGATLVFVPTVAGSDSSANAASTAWVKALGYALQASPAFSGVPTAPTAAQGTSTTQLATTAFAVGSFATGTNSGHVVLASGIIIQWGISTFSSGGSSITFSGVSGCIAFPNSCMMAICNAFGASANSFVSGVSSTTLTAANFINGQSSWIAIGF